MTSAGLKAPKVSLVGAKSADARPVDYDSEATFCAGREQKGSYKNVW
jgi:hypothetical protein